MSEQPEVPYRIESRRRAEHPPGRRVVAAGRIGAGVRVLGPLETASSVGAALSAARQGRTRPAGETPG